MPSEDEPPDDPADPNAGPAENADDASERAPPGEKYCFECGRPIDATAKYCPNCGAQQADAVGPATAEAESSADRVTAGVLAILLGGIGAHHFYLGNIGLGVLYLCFSWTFIPALVGLIEGIIYLAKTDAEFERQYGS